MKPAEHTDQAPMLSDEDLLRLQLRVAQRADKLALQRPGKRTPDADVRHWLDAEREIFGRCTDFRSAAS